MHRKFGEGDKAIAAYVRHNHPEILAAVREEHKVKRAAITAKMRAVVEAKNADRRAARASKLLAELASIGYVVPNAFVYQPPNGAAPTAKVLNGARFYTPAA